MLLSIAQGAIVTSTITAITSPALTTVAERNIVIIVSTSRHVKSVRQRRGDRQLAAAVDGLLLHLPDLVALVVVDRHVECVRAPDAVLVALVLRHVRRAPARVVGRCVPRVFHALLVLARRGALVGPEADVGGLVATLVVGV